ncbi:NAD(P)H-binding protein [Roseospira visakhapatnamensis]|uniref:Nucleoside-diphosphate-sugar epimerase n=1 Tax=Roseospira visakhapatnamensis TaxID=390880 RepID=A0A7W6WBF7_9PROT|nr:NAD(P)H-binding protein [Roseospira visakhapatnamensis]MBB4267979.1 nucleoside-diphosphate-sugar epimerase [Roseospira visakhapatnamensis]
MNALGDPRTRRRLMLFGGARGTGLEVARLARERGWTVVALARPTSSLDGLVALGCTVVIGDALDTGHVSGMLRVHGTGASVVCSLGGGPGDIAPDGRGVTTVVDAMVATGLRRLVMVSSLGAGDSRPFASERLIAAIGKVLEEKSRAEAHARAAGLDLTIIRPGGLVTTPASGEGALFDDRRVHGRIGRGDLAALILHCLETPASIGRTLSAIDRTTLTGPAAPVAAFPAHAP